MEISRRRVKNNGKNQVSVNGQVCRMRGKKLRPGDRVAFAGRELTVQ